MYGCLEPIKAATLVTLVFDDDKVLKAHKRKIQNGNLQRSELFVS